MFHQHHRCFSACYGNCVARYPEHHCIVGQHTATKSEHLQLIDQVLDHLEKAGLRARKEKCQFFVPSITYLGHNIDAKGLHPLPDKIQAIYKAPCTRAKSLLGFAYLIITVICPLFCHLISIIITERKQVKMDSR